MYVCVWCVVYGTYASLDVSLPMVSVQRVRLLLVLDVQQSHRATPTILIPMVLLPMDAKLDVLLPMASVQRVRLLLVLDVQRWVCHLHKWNQFFSLVSVKIPLVLFKNVSLAAVFITTLVVAPLLAAPVVTKLLIDTSPPAAAITVSAESAKTTPEAVLITTLVIPAGK